MFKNSMKPLVIVMNTATLVSAGTPDSELILPSFAVEQGAHLVPEVCGPASDRGIDAE